MDAMNSTYPPNNVNPLLTKEASTRNVNSAMGSTSAQPGTTAYSGTELNPTHTTTGAHVTTDDHPSKLRTALHDMKETVKGTLQRDHHHGNDCAKRPQDGKTNPME
ncbi:hypothetical protein BDF21DRAFT_466147 [Thamnidium elegans]|uniref:Uncharacterized protein n=1 Tax=Thamnidium elegans TaxID=101142 RepID=A0A8H7SLM3_9FUNG|nr:hypothetical protein INT48_008488 [Thamnidium elegans]KAI8067407.1 hypothetical protein BDF21DRAFT_466147 [Thamnidium elegans]